MANFITGNELNLQIEKLFENAKETLILISPFIKLHDRYKSSLMTKLKEDKLKIIVVFGKNEENRSKSISSEDLSFFKELPNVEIRYEKRLHAKYYATENTAIISSMNLYSYSQDNNIESGIITSKKLISSDESLDVKASKYFERVIEQAELIFKNTPVYDNVLLGIKKRYKNSRIEVDRIDDFFRDSTKSEKNDFQNEVEIKENSHIGYCIRTGIEIDFDIERPLSYRAYKEWEKYGDEDYPERYCHYSGEPSNGETCFSKPVLRKYWKEAQQYIDD